MNREIEAKVAVADLEPIKARLRDLQGLHEGEVLESNIFFDTPTSRLKSADRGLRVRTAEPMDKDGDPHRTLTTITFKGPRARGLIKSREETELEVSDAQAATDLLTQLGYGVVFRFEKRRRTWRLDDCIIALDTMPYLGHYVEIEGPSEQSVLSALRRLELAGQPMVTASYISLLISHIDQLRLPIDDVTFAAVEQANRPHAQPQPTP